MRKLKKHTNYFFNVIMRNSVLKCIYSRRRCEYFFWVISRGLWFRNDLKEVMDLGNYGYPDSGYNSAWVNLHEATPPASSLGSLPQTHLAGVPAVSSVASHVALAPAAFTSTAVQFASLPTVVLQHDAIRFYVRYFTVDSRLRDISVRIRRACSCCEWPICKTFTQNLSQSETSIPSV